MSVKRRTKVKHSIEEIKNDEGEESGMEIRCIGGDTNGIVYAKMEKNVRYLDLSLNRLTYLRKEFCGLTNLIELRLHNNRLSALPEHFGKLCNLMVLDLFGNRLTSLPLSFGQLQNLRYLDLGKNPLNAKMNLVVSKALALGSYEACAMKVVKYMAKLRMEVFVNRRYQIFKRNTTPSLTVITGDKIRNTYRRRLLKKMKELNTTVMGKTRYEEATNVQMPILKAADPYKGVAFKLKIFAGYTFVFFVLLVVLNVFFAFLKNSCTLCDVVNTLPALLIYWGKDAEEKAANLTNAIAYGDIDFE